MDTTSDSFSTEVASEQESACQANNPKLNESIESFTKNIAYFTRNIDFLTKQISSFAKYIDTTTTVLEGLGGIIQANQVMMESMAKRLAKSGEVRLKGMPAFNHNIRRWLNRTVIARVASFPKFQELPLEVRRFIWELALPGPRIFEAYYDNQNNLEIVVPHNVKPPLIRGACKEAWKVTEKHGQFILGYYGARIGGKWFNPNKDMVYTGMGVPEHEFDFHGGFGSIPHIGMDWDQFGGEASKDILKKAIALRKCKRVTVIARRRPYCPDEEYRTYSLQPDDAVCLDTSPDGSEILRTWKEIKADIMDVWHSQEVLDELGIQESDLPELDGKEIMGARC
jgi:hypothetical protein